MLDSYLSREIINIEDALVPYMVIFENVPYKRIKSPEEIPRTSSLERAKMLEEWDKAIIDD